MESQTNGQLVLNKSSMQMLIFNNNHSKDW